MKTLYIIGNGFDVAHGLRTDYWHLRSFIEERDGYFLRAFEELYNIQPLDDTEPWYTEKAQGRWNESVNHSLWSEFEKFMGNANTTEMIDMSVSVTEGMPSEGIRHHMDLYWKEQFGFIDKLQQYVKQWIESVNTDNVKCKKTSIIKSNDYFFTFNYTDILEKVYGIKSVLHIHGGVNSVCDIDPIMGHCNFQEIEKHRKWAEEADNDFLEADASILTAVADYLQTIYKDTSNQIEIHKDFFQQLKNVGQVIILGWSAGEVDIPYLKEIIKNLSKDVKWKVYWYDNKAYNSLKRVFDNEGIIDKSIIEYIQSDSFWD